VGSASAQRAAALFAWLNRVKRDGSLPASAFKVAFELGQWINGKIFEREAALVAWPSLETLGAAIGMSERTARDMVKRLQLRGHLSIKVGHGPGHPSRYTLSWENRQSASASSEEETGSRLPLSDEQNRKPGSRKQAGFDTETGSRLPTNHLEPSSNHGESARATLLPDDFQLNEEGYGRAINRLGSREAVDRSMERFANHFRHVDGPKSRSRNWQARALNWIDEDAAKMPANKSLPITAQGLATKFVTDENDFDAVLKTYAQTSHWTRHVNVFGPDPTSPNCRVPQHLLERYGLVRGAA
jgi:hypothetical protein